MTTVSNCVGPRPKMNWRLSNNTVVYIGSHHALLFWLPVWHWRSPFSLSLCFILIHRC
jgi:hypothetical protein